MQIDIEQLVKQVEGKQDLLNALAKVKLDNTLFLKDDEREKGKKYAGSDKMLASVQKPFVEHGVHIQQIASDCRHTEGEYQTLKSGNSAREVKNAKVSCIFTATHLKTGQSMVYIYSTAAVADNSTSMKDAVSGAITTCIGNFIRGLVLVPKLSRSDLGSTKETVNAQHQIAQANKEIRAKLEAKAS